MGVGRGRTHQGRDRTRIHRWPVRACGTSTSVMAGSELGEAAREADGDAGVSFGLRRRQQRTRHRAGRTNERARLSVDQHVLLHQRRRRGVGDLVQDGAVLLESAWQARQDQGHLAPARLPRAHAGGDECDRPAAFWPMFEPRTPGFLHIDAPDPYRFKSPDPARQRRRGRRQSVGRGDSSRRRRHRGGVHRRARAGRRRRDRAAGGLLRAHP